MQSTRPSQHNVHSVPNYKLRFSGRDELSGLDSPIMAEVMWQARVFHPMFLSALQAGSAIVRLRRQHVRAVLPLSRGIIENVHETVLFAMARVDRRSDVDSC